MRQDVVTIAANDIEDRESDYFKIVFDYQGKKLRGTVISISTHGDYKVKVEGNAYD